MIRMNEQSDSIPLMPRTQDAPAAPLLGLVLALVGLAWLGENLGFAPGHVLGSLWPWPLLLLILGVSVLLGGRQHSVGRGLALIAAGLVVWASRERLLPVPFWHLLAPALLVAAGGIVLWRSIARRADG